ncbi:hypothetical protein [Dactylosporangium sp. NPDC051541]|uniref:hypothetical protein n=1 Tax=Dactylosporangium sp. NPDC051541 TaxID=3363977 RepID=UPI0037A5E285
MRLTDQARRAVELAAKAAGGQVAAWHLLLGLAEAEGGAKHALGADVETLRAAGAARFPPEPIGGGGVVFAAEAKAVIEAAMQRARADNRTAVTTIDLLTVLLEGPAAQLIHTAPSLSDHAKCCPETVASCIAPVLEELRDRAADVPRRAWLGSLTAALLLWTLLYAGLLATTWNTSGPEIVLAVAGGFIVLVLLTVPLQVLRRIRQSTARSEAAVPLPDNAEVLLKRLGLRKLQVYVHEGFGGDRCYRLGRRAVVLISAHTERDPGRARFVLWHEVAHLARRDSEIWIVSGLLGLGALFGALLSFDPRAMLLAGFGTPVLSVAGRWWAEAACDRLAVRQVGAAAMRAWATDFRAVLAAARRGDATVRGNRLRGWLTHPPLRLRTALRQR